MGPGGGRRLKRRGGAQILGFDQEDARRLLNFFKLGLRDRFLGSTLGLVWAIVNPLLMMGVFTFVFGFIFRSRLPGAETSLSFVIWLISGYGPWLAISDGLATSTSAVTGNSGLVKNLAFKTELLPIAGSMMGLIPLAVSVCYLVALLVLSGTRPSVSWLAILPMLFLQFVLIAGVGLCLAAVNVFVRDTALALPNVLMILLFSSPIFYPLSEFPKAVQGVLQFHPFQVIAEGYRRPLLYGSWPAPWSLVYLSALSVVALIGGLAFFRRLKGYFDAWI
jgi:homopolymeric O-antigen transport system permease protein